MASKKDTQVRKKALTSKETQERRDRNYNKLHDDWNELGAPVVAEGCSCVSQIGIMLAIILGIAAVIAILDAIFHFID
jgi:hypothetical protein